MNKILCPTDFSSDSKTAINFAWKLAKAFNVSEFTLVHASNMPVKPVGEPSETTINKTPLSETDGSEIMSLYSSIEKEIQEKNLTIELGYRYYEGLPLDVVEHLVDKEGFDLVVMHTKADEREKYEGVYIGSIAQSVLTAVEVPLLLVPPGVPSSADMDRLLYTLDLDKMITNPERVLELARHFDAEVEFFYMARKDKEGASEKMKDLLGKLDLDGLKVDYTIFISKGDFLEDINAEIERINPSVLITGHKQRGFIEKIFNKSLAKRLAHHAHIPLLILQG